MQNIPHFKSYDRATKRLTLSGASVFPLQVLAHADDIEILDMSHGALTTLHAGVAELPHLKIAFFSHNPLRELCPSLSECTNLKMLGLKSCRVTTIAENSLPTNLHWLTLTDNALSALPASIGQLMHLRKLSLAGNQLVGLPDGMRACQNIELIRLGANNFDAMPEWLLTLPRLAWYGGINQQNRGEVQEEIVEIAYTELVLDKLIGSSPSSEVRSAIWKATGKPVAVKIYKGCLTSDGWVEDDMRMWIAAGAHPNIIPVLGKLTGHLEGNREESQGLVLKLIPPDFHSLGLPPSLETCTRDTFPPDTSWPLSFVLKVLQGIASACAHLHGKGIIHGDLYAHNILVNDEGECYLGDFGAASFYDRRDKRFEQIEVRAFGYLIEDLLDHCTEESSALEQLKDDCLNLDIAARPLFGDICAQLEKIVSC